jgi:two-component sensor histidine kinase
MKKQKKQYPYEIEIKDKHMKDYIMSFSDRINSLAIAHQEIMEWKKKANDQLFEIIEDLFPETKDKHLQFDRGKKVIRILGEKK